MIKYLAIFFFVFFINKANAADDPILPIKIHEHPPVGMYTLSFNGKKNKQENGEFYVKDDDSVALTPIVCDDGVCELRPIGQSQPESGLLEDLKILTAEETEDIPYRFIGNLLICFPKANCLGTGFLIGPNHVLTAGHNIYDHSRGGWAKSIVFTPAQNEKNQAPFGRANGQLLKTFKKWVDEKGKAVEYDIGIIILDQRIGEDIGWVGLLSFNTPENKFSELKPIIAGYQLESATIDGKKGSQVQKAFMRANVNRHKRKREEEKITKIQGVIIQHNISTATGNSGSPIMVKIGGGDMDRMRGYYVIAVHTRGGNTPAIPCNEGINITQEYLKKIIDEEVNGNRTELRDLRESEGVNALYDLEFVSPPYHTIEDHKEKIAFWNYNITEMMEYVKQLHDNTNWNIDIKKIKAIIEIDPMDEMDAIIAINPTYEYALKRLKETDAYRKYVATHRKSMRTILNISDDGWDIGQKAKRYSINRKKEEERRREEELSTCEKSKTKLSTSYDLVANPKPGSPQTTSHTTQLSSIRYNHLTRSMASHYKTLNEVMDQHIKGTADTSEVQIRANDILESYGKHIMGINPTISEQRFERERRKSYAILESLLSYKLQQYNSLAPNPHPLWEEFNRMAESCKEDSNEPV